MPSPAPQPGRVILVGAGPGDPGLITVRGGQWLARADAILYDYLVNPRLLQGVRPECQLICLGKHQKPGQAQQPGAGLPQRLWTQDEINRRFIELAQEGKTVVRLKSGDPAIFGRLAEETAALDAAGIAYEIVPGITAAMVAGSHAGVWITNRDQASAVALITGHEKDDKGGSSLDYAALAKFPGTLVFYMGVTTVAEWSTALIAAGKPATTPVMIVRRCSWPDQLVLASRLDRVAEDLKESHLRPPMILIVGEVATDASCANWFMSRPLFGKKVLITRAEEQSAALVERLSELGADCTVQPTITIGPPTEWKPVDDALRSQETQRGASQYHWIVFSSANGVRAFCERLWHLGLDGRALKNAKLAAIGPGTAEALAANHLHADLLPAEYRAESLAEALIATRHGDLRFQRILLIRASRGREVLAEQLTNAGAWVDQVVAYTSTDVAEFEPGIVEQLAGGEFAWVTVTSSAIARNLVRLGGEALRRTRLASISPITSGVLRELGFEPAAEATEYTIEGLVAAILRHDSPD
jgi:uroporphyrinogen III methyltransferase/synthase